MSDTTSPDITIITSVYKNTRYFNELYDSILAQKASFHMLIGIDACEESRKFFKSHLYPNTTILYFPEKSSQYIIANTLSERASKNILFFDADDIMKERLIQQVLKTDSQLVRYKYQPYEDDEVTGNESANVVEGSFFIKKDLFLSLNGFMPFVCGADSEFLFRCNSHGITTVNIDKALFYYRKHSHSLTNSPETGPYSSVRKIAIDYISNHNISGEWPDPSTLVTAAYYEL